MLDAVFLQVLDMSYGAGAAVLFILLARVGLRRAPKRFVHALWGVVLFRLVCPWSPQSALSLLAIGGQTTRQLRALSAQSVVLGQLPRVGAGVPPLLPEGGALAPPVPTPPTHEPLVGSIFTLLWLVGVAALLLYSLITLHRLRRQLRGAAPDGGNVYLSPSLSTPFVLGVFRPNIYLPRFLSGGERDYILLHERTHIRRGDHITKLVSFLVLCVHWFNPLVWLAFFLSGRDMEMACDEAVIGRLGSGVKRAYSTSLLALSTGRPIVGGTPLAFGEGDVRSRIQNVLDYKRPRFWLVAASLGAILAVSVGLMLDPKPRSEQPAGYAAKLWEHRTPYIGNNSAVGNMLSRLRLPQGVEYNVFELHTAEAPYGLTVHLTLRPEAGGDHALALEGRPFQVAAATLFSLIENVEAITFTLADGETEPRSALYTADWAEATVGVGLWQESETLPKFEALLERIEVQLGGAAPSAQEALSMAILERAAMDGIQGDFVCESHVALTNELWGPAGNSSRVEGETVYATVLTVGYNYSQEDGLVAVSRSHGPAAITFDISEDGLYTLREYWTPHAPDDVKGRFPPSVDGDTERYLLVQMQNCHAQAVAHWQLDTTPIIEGLFEQMTATPAPSPEARIAANPEVYRELSHYGDYTLGYIFSEFLRGGQTGLKGSLMRRVMDDFIGSEALPLATDNGQEYFNAWLARGRQTLAAIGPDEMEKHHPKAHLLLTLAGEGE